MRSVYTAHLFFLDLATLVIICEEKTANYGDHLYVIFYSLMSLYLLLTKCPHRRQVFIKLSAEYLLILSGVDSKVVPVEC